MRFFHFISFHMTLEAWSLFSASASNGIRNQRLYGFLMLSKAPQFFFTDMGDMQ